MTYRTILFDDKWVAMLVMIIMVVKITKSNKRTNNYREDSKGTMSVELALARPLCVIRKLVM